MITAELILKAVPDAKLLRVATSLPSLVAAMEEFNITSPLRVAAFLATVFHESGNLSAIEENLNYGAVGLQKTWPSRFDTATSKRYERKPELIANKVYASRMGNGGEASGDGWKYRGAGWIQLTGKDNQWACAISLDVDPLKVQDWLKTEEGASRSAAWFWARDNCNLYADRGDFDGVCDKTNIGRKTTQIGDAIGYAHRKMLYDAFKHVLGA